MEKVIRQKDHELKLIKQQAEGFGSSPYPKITPEDEMPEDFQRLVIRPERVRDYRRSFVR